MSALRQATSRVLQEHVQTGLIDLAGYVVLLGGIVLTAMWLRSLYR